MGYVCAYSGRFFGGYHSVGFWITHGHVLLPGTIVSTFLGLRKWQTFKWTFFVSSSNKR